MADETSEGRNRVDPPGSVPVVVRMVVPVALVVLAAVPWVLAWSSLPDPVASHFALDGTADGHLPRGALAAIHVLGAAACAALLRRSVRAPHGQTPAEAGVVTFVGAVLGGVGATIVVANHDLDDWRDATLGLGWVVAVLGVAAAAALGVAVTITRHVPAPAPASDAGVAVTPGARATWTGSASSTGVLGGAAAAAVLGSVALVVVPSPAVGVTLLVVGVVLATFATVRVRVDSAGVHVRGTFPVPSVHLPLAEIERVTSEDVRPMAWGGWGYRGSLRVARRAAWIVRGGDALVLHLTGGRRFLVTVDDAAAAAAVVAGVGPSRAD